MIQIHDLANDLVLNRLPLIIWNDIALILSKGKKKVDIDIDLSNHGAEFISHMECEDLFPSVPKLHFDIMSC